MARASSPAAKGIIKRYRELLLKLNLPDLTTLLNTTREKNLALRAHVEFLETQDTSFLGSCDLKLHRPAPHWEVTVGDPTDTTTFGFVYWWGVTDWNMMQPGLGTGTLVLLLLIQLCGHDQEETVHFVVVCPRLENACLEALADAPPISGNVLPNRSANPRKCY